MRFALSRRAGSNMSRGSIIRICDRVATKRKRGSAITHIIGKRAFGIDRYAIGVRDDNSGRLIAK